MSALPRFRARPRIGKLLRAAAAFLVLLVVIGLAADYAAYRSYLADLRESTARRAGDLKHLEPPPGMSAEEVVRVGWVWTDKKSCFVHDEEEKPPGVVRIGCFGGSFVYGAEVDEEGDYPAALERVFHEKGFPEVEVLNFGNPWYGCQQAFMLWDSVGRRYDLDCVVLGPGSFTLERDLRFNHAAEQRMYTLHSRYVLDGNDVRRIDLVGDKRPERIDAYYRFLQPLRYLRYDRQPPTFLRCLLGKGRTIANPFYYDPRSELEEAEEIWKRLLPRIPRSGTPLLIVEIEGNLVASLRRLGENTAAIALQWAGFPYRTPENHYNVAGNRLLAGLVFNLLTGRASGFIETFRTTNVEAGESALSSVGQQPLDSYRKVAISTDEQEGLGLFGVVQRGVLVQVVRSFRECNAQALLALSAHSSLLDALFLRLPFDLDPKARLVLFAEATGESIEFGRIETPFPGLPIRVADLSDALVGPVTFHAGRDALRGVLTKPLAERLPWLAARGRVMLRLGELELARAEFGSDRQLFLTPRQRPIAIRAKEADPFAGSEPEAHGTLTLALEGANGEELRVPFGRWSMEPMHFDLGGSLPVVKVPRLPLEGYERVALESDSGKGGHFVEHENGTARALTNFRGEDVRALLALSFSRSLLDALMIPLPALPLDRETLFLDVEGKNASVSLPVRVIQPSTTLDLWVVGRLPLLGHAVRMSDGRWGYPPRKTNRKVRRFTLRMGEVPLVRFERDLESELFLPVPLTPRTLTLAVEEPRSGGPYRLVFEGQRTSESLPLVGSAER
jgi:hypothetical protein